MNRPPKVPKNAVWIEADQDTIGLHHEATLDLDVHRFERLATSEEPDDQEAAIGMYAGDGQFGSTRCRMAL